jgi:hypothetical protein
MKGASTEQLEEFAWKEFDKAPICERHAWFATALECKKATALYEIAEELDRIVLRLEKIEKHMSGPIGRLR